MALEVNGKQIEVDEEGYLSNLNDWEKDIATIMAKEMKKNNGKKETIP